VKERVVPVVVGGLVAYGAGRHAYAFSAQADKWDVLELEDGANAVPIVHPTHITVEHDGRLFVFSAKQGVWNEATPNEDEAPKP
jgi:hypothetical protein